QKIELDGASIDQDLSFEDARFKGVSHFSNLSVQRNLFANKACFTNIKQEANFKSIKVGHNAYFNGTKFSGGAYFFQSNVGGTLEAIGCKVLDATVTPRFRWIRVEGGVSFQNAQFDVSIDFTGVSVSQSFDLRGATFMGEVDFGGKGVIGSLYGNDA